MMNFRNRALRYTVLPGFLPRLSELLFSGFGHISCLLAVLYGAVRLLPANHPYLRPANRGRFGVRHVIAEAANHLRFRRNNIDQIAIFFTTLAGMVLLTLQVALFILALATHQTVLADQGKLAGDRSLSVKNLFSVESVFGHGRDDNTKQDAAQDLAFILMDRIFGMRGIYNSCIQSSSQNADPDIAGVACLDINNNPMPSFGMYPTSFHKAFHALLQFYSYGLFFVACLIILYFFTTIVAETASTGIPFGQRFNRAWAPVRLIFFFALIIPIGNATLGPTSADNRNPGINGAQYITFLVAKWGSNFATNGWGYFSEKLFTAYEAKDYVAIPNPPRDLGNIMQYLFVAKACELIEEKAMAHHAGIPSRNADIQPYIVRSEPGEDLYTSIDGRYEEYAIPLLESDYERARVFSGNGTITIAFGHQGYKSSEEYKNLDNKDRQHPGGIFPQCGRLALPLNTPAESVAAAQQYYFDFVQNVWSDEELYIYADCLTRYSYNRENKVECDYSNRDFADSALEKEAEKKSNPYHLNRTFAAHMIEKYRGQFEYIQDTLEEAIESGAFIDDHNLYLRSKGWGGAGLWYNHIARMNGDVVDAINSTPQAILFPAVMENVARKRAATDVDVKGSDRFNPITASGEEIRYDRPEIDTYIAPALYKAFAVWDTAGLKSDTANTTGTGNFFLDFLNNLFGTHGIFDMYKNANVHPLAQLSSLGKSMMFAAIRNIGVGLSLEALSIPMQNALGKTLSAAAGEFLLTAGMSILALSFVLYYVLPFLPFIYFMFAVSGWIKSIFEAIVAMPLWAMAHIRIDGDGLPGDAAENGYFLLLEIFLRPILIVFGMIAGISLFVGLVQGLNEIFDTLVLNVAGFSPKAAMDAAQSGKVPSLDDLFTPLISGSEEAKQAAAEAAQGQIQGLFGQIINTARGPVDRLFYTAMYVIITYMMGLACFKLVDQVPNQILRWIGVSVTTLSETAGDVAGEITDTTFRGTTLLTQKLSGGALTALLLK